MAFVAGASGNPIDARFRVASQTAAEVDAFPTHIDTQTNAIDFGHQHTPIKPLKVLPGGVPPKMLDGKTPLDPFTYRVGDVDPGDGGMLAAFANVFGTYNTATAASRSRHRFGLAEGTDAAEHLQFLFDNGVTPRGRILNSRLGGFDLEARSGSNFQVSFHGLSPRFDFFEVPTQETGTSSTLPTVQGLLPSLTHDETDLTPDSVWIEVVSNTSGLLSCKASIDSSLPAFAGPNVFAVTIGSDTPGVATDEATGLVLGGDPGAPILVSFPTGATVVANDVFEIEVRRASWTPSFAATRSLPSRNVRMIVNDGEFRFEGGFSLSARWENFSLQTDVPGEQGGTVKRSGVLNVTLTVNREIRDLLFEMRRLGRTRVPIVIDVTSKTIIPGATALPYRFGVVMPALLTGGASYRNNAGATNTDEVAIFTADEPDASYSYDGRTWAGHAHVFVDTGVASF